MIPRVLVTLSRSLARLFLSAVVVSAAAAAIPLEQLEREGGLFTIQVTTAPFSVSKRYKSMQGPTVVTTVNLRDLVAAGSHYRFTVSPRENSATHALTTPSNLPHRDGGTELWWFRGAKIEVLEPTRDVVFNPGFLCHANIDVTPKQRAKLFPSSPGFSERLVTFTAGQMEAVVPEGYGIPVASEENWRFVCQALNQNLEGTHTFRHRITVYFSRDRELKAPLQPLTWTIAWVTVPLDGGEEPSAVCPCCGKLRNGIDAAAAINRYRMQDGRNAVGHWMLPVGTSTWHSAVRELTRGLDRDRELVGTWVHVHPFAERMTLRAYDANCESPRDLWSSRVRNATTGVGLEEVETLSTPKGISMPAAWNYEVEISYNNTSGAKQDAMAMMGLFVTAPEWDAPAWTRSPQRTTLFPEFDPGIASNPASKAGGNTAGSASSNALYTKLPLFRGAAASSDKPYRVEMETSEGVVHFRVMPSWAPKTAAALKQILGHNLYAGLELRPVGDGFALQVPEVRPSGLASEDDRALLCRLPAEPNSKVPHRAGRLTMSMWADQENSVTSSFSFITRDAPHLDGKYTVFAELSDGTTRESLEELAKRAAKGQGIRIVKTSVLE